MNNDIIITLYKRTLLMSLFIIGLCLLLFKEPKPIVLGYIFGMLISFVAFKHLDISVKRSVKMSPRRASAYAASQYLIRYTIYGMVLIVAGKADYLNLWTTVLGLMSIKIVIILSATFKKSL